MTRDNVIALNSYMYQVEPLRKSKVGPCLCSYFMPGFVSHDHHIVLLPSRSHLLECCHFASRQFSALRSSSYVSRGGSMFLLCFPRRIHTSHASLNGFLSIMFREVDSYTTFLLLWNPPTRSRLKLYGGANSIYLAFSSSLTSFPLVFLCWLEEVILGALRR